MGWLFSNDPRHDKAAQVAEFRAPQFWNPGVALLADRIVGNHYWAAVKDRRGDVTIFLALLAKGCRSEGWGYKSMDETVRPYYYDCPLSLLNMATDPPANESAAAWRAKVREYHAKKAARLKPRAGLQVRYGDTNYELIQPAGPRRGWQVARCSDQKLFYMTCRQLVRALNA